MACAGRHKSGRKGDFSMDAAQTTPHRPEENTRRKAITKLIEAVAEQQEALARILEAEHKKIEKATQLYGTSVDDLEDIDESVERILAAVTRLELAIQLKLDLFSECLCPDSLYIGGRTPCMKQHPPGTGACPGSSACQRSAEFCGRRCPSDLHNDRFKICAFLGKQKNWNLAGRQNRSFRESSALLRGNLHRISDYLSSSIRRGRVSRPPEFRDLYGAGRETRPLRCFYGWSDKFPIFLSAVLRADSLMTGFGASGASAFRQWRLFLCVTGAAHAASGAVTAAGAGTLALFPVADLKENNGTDQQDHNDPRDQSWYVHTACSFRFLTLLQKSLLAGLLPGKGSSARANRS